MKKRFAFSLMEVMTLLLILSIVAAATVPLVTKRTLNESHGWYACYYTVNNAGVIEDGMLREIRVENKTEDNAQNRIDHEVSQCYFNFPTGNPKPKVFTITAIGAGGQLSSSEMNVSLQDYSGSANYEDSDVEIRKHHILSDTWGYLMNPVMANAALDASGNYPSGWYGAKFSVVNANGCDNHRERYTFCKATPGEYVRTVYRLNDTDPNELQRLKIDIGKPSSAATPYHASKRDNQPVSGSTARTVVTTAAGSEIVVAQGGYKYQYSNNVTKIIVPAYNELACKQDGLKLCPQVDGCTMNDYRICVDGGFIADFNTLTQLSMTYPATSGTAFWLTNRLIHTPGIFDGQPEFEAFNNIYHTGLPDSGCDANGQCTFRNRRLAFGDPSLVFFEKTRDGGDPLAYILAGATSNIGSTYLNATYREQNARGGLVFITW